MGRRNVLVTGAEYPLSDGITHVLRRGRAASMSILRGIPVTTRPRLEQVAVIVVRGAVLPLLRARGRRRLATHTPGGVTVVTVNWNSWPHLEVLIDVVRRRSDRDLRLLVVDNGSRDESRARLAERPDVMSLLLPVNVSHEVALDLGVLLCETEYVVTLDVDAFPLHDGWLERLLAPLRSGEAQVSGARLNRDYVHPCCWAMRTERFVSRGHSFRSRYRGRQPDRDASGDVGEEISRRESPGLHFLEVSSQLGPGDVGTVFGGVVYHNFYATRFRATKKRILDKAVAIGDAERAWNEALRRYAR